MHWQDIESIKVLKGKYFRYLDTNDWKNLRDLFIPSATAEYSDGDHSFSSADAIIEFLSSAMSGRNMLTMHTGHTPEITSTGDDQAEGIWYLHDVVLVINPGIEIMGNGIYSDKYCRIGNEWKFEHTGYKRIFEVQRALNDDFKVLKNNYTD